MAAKIKNNCGFTLVEMIVVMAILGVAISAIYTFFFFAQDSFNRTDRQSRLIQDMNLAVARISRDIRSASKPNALTNSVVLPGAGGTLAAGQSMNIYTYDSSSGKYICISYRLKPDDKTVLQRGTVECPTASPPAGANPSYGTVANWETILTGVAYKDSGGNDIKLFTDVTQPSTNDRREIELYLSINDAKNPLPKAVELKMTVTSRSEGVS